MKTRVLLFLLFVVTLSAVGTLIALLFNSTPTTKEIIGLFYLALGATAFGLVFFALYGASALRLQAIPDWQSTLSALRIGLIAGVFIPILLAIQSVELLNVATFIILVLLAVASELMLRRKLLILKK